MTYTTVVFMQGEEAWSVIDKLENTEGVVRHGETAETIATAVEYLSQWDYGTETDDTETRDGEPALYPGDKDAKHGGYTLVWNPQIGHVSLTRDPL